MQRKFDGYGTVSRRVRFIPPMSRFRIVGLILLGGVLVLLAGLQFHWLNEISQAQIRQTREQLEAGMNQLTCQFDSEIGRATMAFMPRPGQDSTLRGAVANAWDEWRRSAPDPQLLMGVALLEWNGQQWAPSFTSAPAESTDFSSQLPQPVNPEGGHVWAAGPTMVTVHGNPVLLQPAVMPPARLSLQPGFFAPRLSWLALTLNRDYLLRDLLPGLVQRNLAPVAQTDYALRMRSGNNEETVSAEGKRTAWRKADVTKSLFRNGPGCLGEMHLVSTGLAGVSGGVSISVGGPPQVAVMSSSGFGRQLVAGPGAPPRLSGGTEWELLVRHRSGSLDQAFADFRRRNLFASVGVLLILAASIATLTLSAERAHTLAKAQTEMAIGLSHELRTPLTALRVAAGNLQSGAVTNEEQARRYGSIIDGQSKRLLDLVENTMSFARAQPTVSALTGVRVAPGNIVRAAIESRAAELDKAGMRVELAAENAPSISGDVSLLTHCLENLIDNAIKYARQGKYLGVRAERAIQGRRAIVRIAVEDRGAGIPPADLPHIFEPFYRGVSTRSSCANGIGLGLAFVKRVIAAHGGSVDVETCQRGTTFFLELPAVPEESAA